MNPTIEKFGYPATLIKEFDHWVVLLRPAQVTLGSLVLAAKSDATAYSELAREAFAEQAEAVAAIERALAAFARYEHQLPDADDG
jgi:diadenosine tetraphosphate (Ap4A) HIT family hydrolase